MCAAGLLSPRRGASCLQGWRGCADEGADACEHRDSAAGDTATSMAPHLYCTCNDSQGVASCFADVTFFEKDFCIST